MTQININKSKIRSETESKTIKINYIINNNSNYSNYSNFINIYQRYIKVIYYQGKF